MRRAGIIIYDSENVKSLVLIAAKNLANSAKKSFKKLVVYALKNLQISLISAISYNARKQSFNEPVSTCL